jgi:hypothetical protein
MPDNKPKAVPELTQDDIQRFWGKVDDTPGQGPQGACWTWTSALTKSGYGVFQVGYSAVRANRVAYLIQHGQNPGNTFVLHSCDNKACVRKEHLSLGDHAQNMRESMDRGRVAVGDRNGSRLHPDALSRGSAHHNAKVTEDQVLKMRGAYANGQNATTLAAENKLSIATTCKILRGQSWAHASGEITTRLLQTGVRHHGAKLTEEQVRAIREERAHGATYAALTAKYGVTLCPLQAIVSRRTWKHVA